MATYKYGREDEGKEGKTQRVREPVRCRSARGGKRAKPPPCSSRQKSFPQPIVRAHPEILFNIIYKRERKKSKLRWKRITKKRSLKRREMRHLPRRRMKWREEYENVKEMEKRNGSRKQKMREGREKEANLCHRRQVS